MSDACPACGHPFDADTCIHDPEARPKPNDLTLCIECGLIMAYTHDGGRRVLMTDEIRALDAETREEVERISRAIRHARGAVFSGEKK